MSELNDALEAHHVAVAGDRVWQSRLRLLQALWRKQRNLPMGSYVPGRGPRKGQQIPLGSRIQMPFAREQGSNFLTGIIWRRVQEEIRTTEEMHPPERLIIAPRIYEDLLSSQPLCFNLFAELGEDRDLATRVAQRLWPDVVGDGRVTGIEFEWSPGRQKAKYLNNGSAFDACIHFVSAGGTKKGFVGIETKYHESLVGKPATMKARYRQVAEASNVFEDVRAPGLKRLPLQQIWLDHLLALSMLEPGNDWSSGKFVLLFPETNDACTAAARDYRAQLQDDSTFQGLTMEAVVTALKSETDASWVTDFEDRYLARVKLEELVAD